MSALNNLLLVQYNNYFNRIIKKEDSYESYIASSSNNKIIENINFNPNDGVTTEHVINWSENWMPDYVIILDNEDIVSRWFITEAVRLRGKQYQLTLKRDVIADYKDEVISSPCFIEKGYVDSSNPLIFNKENFTCNQIKQEETLLTDKTNCSWLVLYYNLSKKTDLKVTNALRVELDYENISGPINQWYPDYQSNGYILPTRRELYIKCDSRPALGAKWYHFADNGRFIKIGDELRTLSGNLKWDDKRESQSEIAVVNSFQRKFASEDVRTSIKNAIDLEYAPTTDISDLIYYNGKIVRDSLGNFYRISFYPDGTDVTSKYVNEGQLFNTVTTALNLQATPSYQNPFYGNTTDSISVGIEYTRYRLVATLVNDAIPTFSADFSSCRDIIDQPFGILAIPYKTSDNSALYFTSSQGEGLLSETIAMSIVKELTKAGVGTGNIIYDVQLLPYCPVTYAESNKNQYGTFLQDNFEIQDRTIIKDSNDNIIGVVLHPESSKFTNNIQKSLEVPSDVKDFKTRSECDFARLCSPNYNGIYEFNVEKNNGVSYFNIDCTYKPYQPYIHINPDFKNLYGQDFNDPRGLICGGDFSITIVSNAWEQYKLQNKNYQEIFNRQIENMDVSNKIQNTKSAVNIALGALGGAAGGAISTSISKKPAMAALGAGVGGAVGLAGGIANLVLQRQQQAENKDYAIDMHEYQLQNVQALPDSLSKVDAFNNNNKIFPVLEEYSCTDTEREILKNKIKYEGMTINAIGTLAQYIGEELTFCKGQMIRIEGVKDDTHLLNSIYEEIAKGVYL